MLRYGFLVAIASFMVLLALAFLGNAHEIRLARVVAAALVVVASFVGLIGAIKMLTKGI